MPHVKPLQLDRFLPYRLSVLSNTVSSAIAGAYERRFGLSIPEWRVIAVLAAREDLSAAEVAQRTAMDKVAVSRAVTSLLKARRVQRRVSRSDRRRSLLRLSGAGERVYREVVPFALAYERELLRPLDSAERAALDRTIAILLGRATEMGPVHTD
jgi:DNA-binding MarR family transcriptional regulator